MPAFALYGQRLLSSAAVLDKVGSCHDHFLDCPKKVRTLAPSDPPGTVNRYINPAADLDRGSGDDLQLDRAGVEGAHALPLSAAQLGIWFAQQIDACPFAYNIGEYIEIEGSIDPILFKRALEQVICETEALGLRIVCSTYFS